MNHTRECYSAAEIAKFLLDCMLFAREHNMPNFDNDKCFVASKFLSPIQREGI